MEALLNQTQQEQADGISRQSDQAGQEAPQSNQNDEAQAQEVTAPTDENAFLSDENAALKSRLLDTKGQMAAMRLGADMNRIPFLMKLAAMDGIDVTADTADGEITAALKEVLDQIPEWKPSEKKDEFLGTGASGAHRRSPAFGGNQRNDNEQAVLSQFRQGMK